MKLRNKTNQLLAVVTNEKLWLFILSVTASIINYAFQIYIGRRLTVYDYGGFNYVVTFMTNCCSFYVPFSVIICRLTSENGRNLHANNRIYNQIIKAVIIVSILMLLFILIYICVFNSIEITWILFVSTIIISGICTIILGVVQGLAKYMAYGVFNALLMGIKLILAIFIARNKQGAIMSLFLSELAVFILAIFFLIKIYQKERSQGPENTKELTMQQLGLMYGGTLWVQLLNSLYINNGEILLLKYVIADDVLGLYSVAAMLSRIGMYATAIISTIILPEIAYKKAKDLKAIIGTFNLALIISLGIAFIYVFILVLTKDIVIQKLYGDAYLGAREIIDKMIILVIGISVLPVINSFYLGINRLMSIITIYVVGAIFALVITFGFKISFDVLIISYGIIILSIDVVGYLIALFLCKSDKISIIQS